MSHQPFGKKEITGKGSDVIFTEADKWGGEVYSVINGNKIPLSDISSCEKSNR